VGTDTVSGRLESALTWTNDTPGASSAELTTPEVTQVFCVDLVV
jgi:hypothetical protein